MTGKGERKKTILVVSLDPQLADVRKHVLEDAGLRVLAASHLKAVTDTCQKEKHRPHHDWVLTTACREASGLG
jgi:CheY-like chemotaxis protein